MWTALIGPISSLAGSFIEGQVSKQKAKANLAQTEAEAKAEIMKTAATHDSKWELIMAESTKSSIKDEIVTVIDLNSRNSMLHSRHGRHRQKRL